MRWRLGRRSQNVEDRRGMGTPVGMRFPGRVRMPGGLGRGGGGVARGGGIGVIGLADPARARLVPRHRPELPLAGYLDRRALSRGAAGGRAAGRRPAGAVRLGRARRHRGHLARAVPPDGRRVSRADPGPVLGRGRLGLRLRSGRHGAVLLPGRPEGLHRPRLLRRAARPLRRARRLRPGLRDRPRGRAPRAEAARHLRAGAGGAAAGRRARGQRAVGDDWSCRPTASPASGAITPTRAATCSRRAMSRRG